MIIVVIIGVNRDCTSIDCVRLINEDHMISGSMDGQVDGLN